MRAAHRGACSGVFEAVGRMEPPPSGEVADLEGISVDSGVYAVDGKGSVVPTHAAKADLVSLPGGAIGAYRAMPNLGKSKSKYTNVNNVLCSSSIANLAAAATPVFVGFSREEYIKVVIRTLRVGMSGLYKKVKVVNGMFGVWKKLPKGGEPGVIRLIIDMRRGNCFFNDPDPVDLVSPHPMTRIELGPEEVGVCAKADLDIYFYRCTCYF